MKKLKKKPLGYLCKMTHETHVKGQRTFQLWGASSWKHKPKEK